MNSKGDTVKAGACRAAVVGVDGKQYIFTGSLRWAYHAEDDLMAQMKAKGWNDFKYMYVEIEPCHDGALSRKQGDGCKDRLKKAFPASNATVYYSHSQAIYVKGDAYKLRGNQMVQPPDNQLIKLGKDRSKEEVKNEVKEAFSNSEANSKAWNAEIAKYQQINKPNNGDRKA